MSKLSKKEIEYFAEQLPEGLVVVDLKGIKKVDDFVQEFCPIDFNHKNIPYSIKISKSIEEFLNKAK